MAPAVKLKFSSRVRLRPIAPKLRPGTSYLPVIVELNNFAVPTQPSSLLLRYHHTGNMTKSLVTGGSGFIGLYVVKLLLERGHYVTTTVRSLKNTTKCKPLLDLQAKYSDSLTLFEADLMKDGSFHRAMEGCEVVYHIASPFLVPQQIKDGLKECVEPALQGTKNVLQSANDIESVKRVVLTSSGRQFPSLCVLAVI